jgi:hypoxanthine phosphoribosyltransferase
VTAELRRVSWADHGAACDRLRERLAGPPPDLVVGVAKGGLPLAVALCHQLRATAFGTVHLFQSASDDAGDLDVATGLDYQGAVLPDGDYQRIVLVDDVVAKGLVVTEAERLLRVRYGPGTEIIPVAAFADPAGIAAGPVPDLGRRLIVDQEIDNTRVWIVFPWERQT